MAALIGHHMALPLGNLLQAFTRICMFVFFNFQPKRSLYDDKIVLKGNNIAQTDFRIERDAISNLTDSPALPPWVGRVLLHLLLLIIIIIAKVVEVNLVVVLDLQADLPPKAPESKISVETCHKKLLSTAIKEATNVIIGFQLCESPPLSTELTTTK